MSVRFRVPGEAKLFTKHVLIEEGELRNGQSITAASKLAITLHCYDCQKNNTGLATLPAQRATHSPSPGSGLGEVNSASKWRPSGPAIRFGPKNQMPVGPVRRSRKNRTAGPLDLHGAAAVLRSQAAGLGWVNEWSFGPKTVATQN